jgi:hypothetical protein
MIRVASALAAATLAATGCGGADKPRAVSTAAQAGQGEAAREAEAKKLVPGKRLSPRDRVAYYQVATTSGLLRARAATVLSGRRGTSRVVLQAGRDRLALVRPDSGALGLLRDRLGAAADALLAREGAATARAAMRATDLVNASLQRFSKGKAVRLLLPD